MGSSEADDADVLVVDDVYILRRELTDSLKSQGIRALAAGSGGEAVELAKSRDIKVALVDLRMSGMDGIETAKALQSSTNMSVIFFSAFGNDADRSRAVHERLNVEQWIDKDPSDPQFESAIKAVRGVLMRRHIETFIGEINRRLTKVAADGQLTTEQIAALKKGLDLPSLVIPEGIAISRKQEELATPVEPDVISFDELLSILGQYKDDLLSNYGDPAHREIVWDQIRTLVQRDLWRAVSAPHVDAFLRQLVVQLEQAVRRIPAPLLERKHIDVLSLSLERIRSSHVDKSDVAMCKKQWRATGVDTMPSFEKIMREWEILYAAEGLDDQTDQHRAGDDNPNAQDS